jgi:hypothetical protein
VLTSNSIQTPELSLSIIGRVISVLLTIQYKFRFMTELETTHLEKIDMSFEYKLDWHLLSDTNVYEGNAVLKECKLEDDIQRFQKDKFSYWEYRQLIKL